MASFSDSEKIQQSSKMADNDELAAKLPPPSDCCQSSNNAATSDVHEDLYEDAIGEAAKVKTIDLEKSFEDCDRAIQKFFNNDVEGAIAIMKPWSDTSLYHSLGLCIFEFIPAILSYDPSQIQKAAAAIKSCIDICSRNRKHYTLVESLGSLIKKPNYAAYTDLEAHAELCYAEALLLQAALTIIEGEDFTGFIRGTIKVNTCYNTYQACYDIKETKKWDSVASRLHFNSGVRLGTAAFHLMISQLPPRLVSLLEFVGFHGNQYYGLNELEKGSRMPGMRAILCDLTLLAYHLVICQFIGREGDLKKAIILIDEALQKYPESVWFLAFQARYEYLLGDLQTGINIYKNAITTQGSFRQFRLLCYWELMWVYGLKLDFLVSADYAGKLVEENGWSKTTHTYIQAAMLMQAAGDEMSHSELVVVNELMLNAQNYKVRLAGKSLPMEKFVIRRCKRFQVQNGHLVLPGLEVLTLWNLLPILTMDNKPLLQHIYNIIQRTHNVLKHHRCNWQGPYVADNKALLHYLAGCTLLALEEAEEAIIELKKVLELKRQIKEDTFLIPYALCEMAMCHFYLEEMDTTLSLLNEANKKYSGYSLESRLNFRVHARIQMVQDYIGRENPKYLKKDKDAKKGAK